MNLKQIKEKLKSYPMWIALFSLIALILKNFFDYEIPEYNTMVELIMTILIAFGVVNNPNSRNSL